MRMYRMIVALVVLALLLTPTLFAAGEQEADAGGSQTLSMWTLFGGGEGSIMEDLIDQFNEEHDDITIEEQKLEWDQYYNRLLTSLVGGTAPDIAIMHLAVLPDYASRDVLYPIGEQLSSEFRGVFLDNIIEKARYEGMLYAIPIDTHPIVLYYNKGLLRDAGLTDSNGDALVPETWSDFYDYASQVQDSADVHGLTMETGAMLGERLFTALYAQMGGRLVNEATGELSVDQEIATQVYEMMLRPFEEGLAQGPVAYEDTEALFQDNQSVFHVNGVWAMAVYPSLEDVDFGVTQLPAVSGSPHYTWGDSHSLVFPEKDDPAKLAAALTFGEWFSGQTMEWAAAGHIPVNEEVLEAEEFLNLPMRSDYLEAAGNAVLAPSVQGWSRVREEMWEIGEAMILGDITPSEAAQRLSAVIEDN